MTLIDYIDDNSLRKGQESVYENQQINTIILNGYVYRGDIHNGITVSTTKTIFFGTYMSSKEYAQYENTYIKKYVTKQPLRLLDLTATTENTKNIPKFFLGYVLEELTKMNNSREQNELKIKVILILLQIFYGLIDGYMENLNMHGLETDMLLKFMEKNMFIRNVKLFGMILRKIANKNHQIQPSRTSLGKFDRYIMLHLQQMLLPIGIHGCFYIEQKYENHDVKTFCQIMNTLFTEGETCIPSEICIFTPDRFLFFSDIKHIKHVKNNKK